jgi:hypothetical protein
MRQASVGPTDGTEVLRDSTPPGLASEGILGHSSPGVVNVSAMQLVVRERLAARECFLYACQWYRAQNHYSGADSLTALSLEPRGTTHASPDNSRSVGTSFTVESPFQIGDIFR